MKLVIIDGKSVFYRGFYAMGALSRSDGKPTGGVYGFAVIAMELVKEIKPDKVVVAWDKAKTSITKRRAIYPEYKAGRVKPPEAFFEQIPLLVELINDLGWTFLETDNYEADDIIGTLARQATMAQAQQSDSESLPNEVIIISSDLDMLQIVDEHVKMYRLLKGFSDLEEIDVKALEEKYGIRREQFLDMKALKGDASDNIPGVPGIGEKGAVKLLNDYGSLEGIYEHIDEIKGATQKKLIAGKESAEMSYQLAKIMFDAPVRLVDVPDLVINHDRIIAGLRKLEFNSLIRKFEKENIQQISSSSTEELDAKKVELPDGFQPEIVEWDVKAKMWRNADFAEEVLVGKKIWDLNQGRFVLSGKKGNDKQGQLGLDFGETDKQVELKKQQKEFLEIPKAFKVFSELDMPLIPVLYKMEKRGMLISREYFDALGVEFATEISRLERKIMELSGREFNINSPVQLSEILFEKLRLPTQGIKKTQRGYSTGVDTLEKLKDEHEIIPLIMEYRQISKLQSTYVLPLPELADSNNRVHTHFTQDVTATGRLSSVNPNLQNIPVRTEEGKRIRMGFVVPEGKSLVSADYSQFELRLAAVLAGDQPLIDDFNAGIDIHKKTASDVFGVPIEEVTKAQRRAAKVVNFGVLYGMSAQGLAKAADMQFYEARDFIKNYFQVRKPIQDYLNKILTQAREQGYVETYFGRRKPTPGVLASNAIVRQAEERAAQNMPIQGTEADLMKKAMIQVDAKLPVGAELVMQVHDSLIVECNSEQVPEVSKILRETMEGIAPELAIKLAVEVTNGQNWGEI